MADKKIPMKLKMWLGAVLGSLLAFFIAKVFWNDIPAPFLLVFLIIGYLINFFVSIVMQYKRD